MALRSLILVVAWATALSELTRRERAGKCHGVSTRTYFERRTGCQNRCGGGLIDIKQRLDKTDIFPDGALVV